MSNVVAIGSKGLASAGDDHERSRWRRRVEEGTAMHGSPAIGGQPAMTGLASCVLDGEPALLAASQAQVLDATDSHETLLLGTEDFRIAVRDRASGVLVVFDRAALISLARQESTGVS